MKERGSGAVGRRPSFGERVNTAGKRAEIAARRLGVGGPTPSSRPGENGREWANHKYIDKRKTKSGKIRYIYDNIEAGGQRHRDANDQHAENLKRRQKNARKNLKATHEGQRNRDRQTTFGNSALGRAKGRATQAYKDASKSYNQAVGKARKSYDQAVSDGRKWIRNTFGF